jgi:hypothetical protein
MRFHAVFALSTLCLCTTFCSAQTSSPAPIRTQQITNEYSNLPLSFEANHGQASSDTEFLARGKAYTIQLHANSSTLRLRDANGGHSNRLNIRLQNSKHVPAQGAEPLPGAVNYLIGDSARWITNVPTFARVQYAGVYPATDLVYYGNHGQLEYDFIVHPGGSANAIAMKISGAKRVHLLDNGDLALESDANSVVWHRPVAYQEIDGRKKSVRARYEINGNTVAFRVGAYNHQRDLVIDPALAYSTYLGGSSDDRATGIAVDGNGNAYITGSTKSTDFPTTSGAYDRSCGSDGKCNYDGDSNRQDLFVTKLNTTGTALVYSTYIGGNSWDDGFGIAVDASGNAVVVGQTSSTDFATKALGNANSDTAFAAKLNSTGSSLIYAVRFGGSACENGSGASGVKIDSSGNAIVVGNTDCSDFSTTTGVFQPNYGGAAPGTGGDAFIAKINPSGSAFVWASYLGGDQRDVAYDLALDTSNNVYVTGYTSSRDFPVSSTAFQKAIPSNPGSSFLQTSPFVTKVNASGSTIAYSTYLGGSFIDTGNGIAVTGDNAIVVGVAQSSNFPTTTGVVQRTLKGPSDAFITRLNSTGSALVYSTYLGGSSTDLATGVAVNSSGNAYVIGHTYSSNFPTTVYGFQRVQLVAGDEDDFVAELSPAGTSLPYSSYLGGSGVEEDQNFARITLDSHRNVYAAGATQSTDFPTTPTAYRTTLKGSNDAWVTKIRSLCSLGTTNPSVTICKPAANTTVSSPVEIEVGTYDLTPVWVIQVYLDGKKVYQAHLSALDIKLPMSTGTHRLTVQAQDTKQVVFKKTIYIAVK